MRKWFKIKGFSVPQCDSLYWRFCIKNPLYNYQRFTCTFCLFTCNIRRILYYLSVLFNWGNMLFVTCWSMSIVSIISHIQFRHLHSPFSLPHLVRNYEIEIVRYNIESIGCCVPNAKVVINKTKQSIIIIFTCISSVP